MNNPKISKPIIILTLLVIFHFMANYFWLAMDSLSLHRDTISHLDNQLDFLYSLRTIVGSENTFAVKLHSMQKMFINHSVHPYWSPFQYIFSSIIIYYANNIPLAVRLFPNMIFFAIIIFSVYYLSRAQPGNSSGLFAASVVSFYPAIFGMSRTYGLDFPLTGLVCLSIFLLLKSKYFTQRKICFLLGISAGFGILTKAQFILFLAGPFTYVFYKALKTKNYYILKPQLANIAIVFLVATCVSWWWLGKNFIILWEHFINRISGNMMMIPVVMKPDIFRSLTYYLASAIKGISLIIFIFVLFAFLRVILRVKKISDGFMVGLLWFIIPYAIFTCIPLKDDSYFYPALPAMALILSNGLNGYKVILRKIIYSVLLAFIFVDYFIASFYNPSYGKLWNKFASNIFMHSSLAHPPRQDNHKIVAYKFSAIIKKDKNAEPVKIGIIENSYFCGDVVKSLGYFLRQYLPEVELCLSSGGGWPFFINDDFLRNANNFDYIIAFNKKPEDKGPDFEGLTYFKSAGRTEELYREREVGRIIDNFSVYPVICKGLLTSRLIPAYLLAKDKNNSSIVCPDRPASGMLNKDVPHPKVNWLSGIVSSVNLKESQIGVNYREGDDIVQGLFYIGRGTTEYKNVNSDADININDKIIVDYFITAEGRRVARVIEIDNILDIPEFSLNKPSGSLRRK